MTVYDDRLGSPCVGGNLSSSDIAGRLLPVVPAGMSFPVGHVDPATPAGLHVAWGPVSPDGMLSTFFSDPAGCAGGPVCPYGTLSPSDSDPAGPAGFAGGLCGTLSPFKYDPAGPDGLYGSDGPVGPLSPSNPGGVFPLSDPTPGVRYLQVWGPLPRWLWYAEMHI